MQGANLSPQCSNTHLCRGTVHRTGHVDASNCKLTGMGKDKDSHFPLYSWYIYSRQSFQMSHWEKLTHFTSWICKLALVKGDRSDTQNFCTNEVTSSQPPICICSLICAHTDECLALKLQTFYHLQMLLLSTCSSWHLRPAKIEAAMAAARA